MLLEFVSPIKSTAIAYAQCWEDADILLEALDVQPGHTCLSIASAGDNTFAMLSRNPQRVIAVDRNPAQIACLELRAAAYRELGYQEVLELLGSRPNHRRAELYLRCRRLLSSSARRFWDAHPMEIATGIGGVGRFEQYLSLFRTRILPLIHSRERVERLLEGGTREEREAYFDNEWDTWRWRTLFRMFFSRFMMERLGRDPAFFQYVTGSVAEHILARTHHALTVLNPAENPYLHWILTGYHATALPHALRAENFETIRANLDRLEWHCCSVEEFLERRNANAIDRFNLSDVFEYVSGKHYVQLLKRIIHVSQKGGRLAYWNMLVDRHRPKSLAHQLRSLTSFAHDLHQKDKAFFYRAFVVEEILTC